MINIAFWIVGVLLIASTVLVVIRIEKGPSMLDRIVSLDVLVAILIGIMAIYSAVNGREDMIPVIVVLSVVGFVGSVTLARFVAAEPEESKRILSKDEEARVEAIKHARAQALADEERRQGESGDLL